MKATVSLTSSLATWDQEFASHFWRGAFHRRTVIFKARNFVAFTTNTLILSQTFFLDRLGVPNCGWATSTDCSRKTLWWVGLEDRRSVCAYKNTFYIENTALFTETACLRVEAMECFFRQLLSLFTWGAHGQAICKRALCRRGERWECAAALKFLPQLRAASSVSSIN